MDMGHALAVHAYASSPPLGIPCSNDRRARVCACVHMQSSMFYIQLGPVMQEFYSPVASFVSLSRALFGDFDIDDIMSNSADYSFASLFLAYLFVTVFILLSMFLARAHTVPHTLTTASVRSFH